MGASGSKSKPQDRGVPPRKILEPFNFSERILRLADKQVDKIYDMADLEAGLIERRRKEGCTFDGKSPLKEDGICRESSATRHMYEKYNRLSKEEEDIGEKLQKLVREEKADEIAEAANLTLYHHLTSITSISDQHRHELEGLNLRHLLKKRRPASNEGAKFDLSNTLNEEAAPFCMKVHYSHHPVEDGSRFIALIRSF